MSIRLRYLSCLFSVSVTLGNLTHISENAYAQGPSEFLDWSIEISKKAFYPGEPILLTINIKNRGDQEQEIYFGGDGIGAFSFEIFDSNNNVVAKREKIERYGVSRIGTVKIAPLQIGTKSIVLNQWCSTLLPPGYYHVICNVGYSLFSEFGGDKGAPLHEIKLGLDIEIAKLDNSKFKKLLEDLVEQESKISAIKPRTNDRTEIQKWSYAKRIAREMIVFTESELAVPYQLRMLKVEGSTWLKVDLIHSLARSKTLQAAIGLVQIIENPSIYMEDVKREAVDAVYRLRETGKSEIIKATDDFVAKYKRPVLSKPID